MSASKEPSTWAEMVQSIDKERKSLPWDPNSTQPVERVSLYHRKRQEREFNPVAMEFRDPKKEGDYQQKRKEIIDNKVKSAEDTLNKTFNVINHQGPPRKMDLVPRPNKESSRNREYHMITNLPFQAHDNSNTFYDEDFNLSFHRTFSDPLKSKPSTSIKKIRDFNIISNNYFHNNEEKRAEDYNHLKSHVLKKYWETHDYDFIRGRYYSPEKEEKYREQKSIINEVQGVSQERRLPPSIQYSEGHSFNIVTHDVYDDTKLRVTMTEADRTLHRMKRHYKDNELKSRDEEKAQVDADRHMNRISYKRWETEIDRAYNPIKNEVTLTVPKPFPSRPATMWAKLTMNSEDAKRPNNNDSSYTNNLTKTNSMSMFASGNLETLPRMTPPNTSEFNRPQSQREPLPSTRGKEFNSKVATPNFSRHSSNDKVPSLDLTKAESGPLVTYKEPSNAPPGLPIPMVRTGGISNYQ